MVTTTEREEANTFHRKQSLLRGLVLLVTVSICALLLVVTAVTWAAPPGDNEPGSRLPAAAMQIAAGSRTPAKPVYMPLAFRQPSPTPTATFTPTPTPTATATPTSFPPIPGANYVAIPVEVYTAPDRIDYLHADLNLDLRGYVQVSEFRGLVDIGGSTHITAPHLADLFYPARLSTFLATYRVYNWKWADPPALGQPDGLIDGPFQHVTFITMATTPGEVIYLPSRNDDIYNKIYHAQVLYATDNQITFVYTRSGSVAAGYTVHITNIWVEPALVALYQATNTAGRYYLPALSNGQPIGRAKEGGIGVAIRDTGDFMDPRSRKDWWPGW